MVDAAARPGRPAASGATQALSWLQMILLSIVAPIVIYDVLTDHGVSEVWALVASGIGPLLDIAISWVRSRRIDEFGVMVLAFLAVGVVLGFLFSDPRILLLKESVATGVFGVLLLGSTVVLPRPLMFYFGRRFATGGDPGRIDWWNGLWRYPGFRRTQYVMTAVWGVTLLVEAVVRAVLTYQLSVDTMVVVNAIAPPVVIAALVVWTVVYARRSQAAGARAAAAARKAA